MRVRHITFSVGKVCSIRIIPLDLHFHSDCNLDCTGQGRMAKNGQDVDVVSYCQNWQFWQVIGVIKYQFLSSCGVFAKFAWFSPPLSIPVLPDHSRCPPNTWWLVLIWIALSFGSSGSCLYLGRSPPLEVTRSTSLVKTIMLGTIKGGRRRGSQGKRWDDNIIDWTGLEMRDTLGRSGQQGRNGDVWWRNLLWCAHEHMLKG